MANQTGHVKRELKASGTAVVGTAYYPSSSGVDLSLVKDPSTIVLWLTNAGDASSSIVYTVEYSRDGSAWFDGPPTYGLDIFATITTVAVKFARKLSVHANYFRVKEVVSTATTGACDIQMTYDGGAGSYAV